MAEAASDAAAVTVADVVAAATTEMDAAAETAADGAVAVAAMAETETVVEIVAATEATRVRRESLRSLAKLSLERSGSLRLANRERKGPSLYLGRRSLRIFRRRIVETTRK